MKPLPLSDHALVIRTDFSNQAAWDAIKAIIARPVDGFYAYVHYVDDPEYDRLTREQLLELFRNYNQTYAMVVDDVTVSSSDYPILIVDMFEGSGAEFRAIPSTIQSVENNLSIANMDFEDFANAVDETGVFRGFPY